MSEFEDFIVQAAKEVASAERQTWPNCFTQAENLLMDLINKKNDAFKNYVKRLTNENHLPFNFKRRKP